jgi:hypothetical protein
VGGGAGDIGEINADDVSALAEWHFGFPTAVAGCKLPGVAEIDRVLPELPGRRDHLRSECWCTDLGAAHRVAVHGRRGGSGEEPKRVIADALKVGAGEQQYLTARGLVRVSASTLSGDRTAEVDEKRTRSLPGM